MPLGVGPQRRYSKGYCPESGGIPLYARPPRGKAWDLGPKSESTKSHRVDSEPRAGPGHPLTACYRIPRRPSRNSTKQLDLASERPQGVRLELADRPLADPQVGRDGRLGLAVPE